VQLNNLLAFSEPSDVILLSSVGTLPNTAWHSLNSQSAASWGRVVLGIQESILDTGWRLFGRWSVCSVLIDRREPTSLLGIDGG